MNLVPFVVIWTALADGLIDIGSWGNAGQRGRQRQQQRY